MPSPPPINSRWDQLYELAASQDGYFSVRQAKDIGMSAQLLSHHARTKRIARAQRGVYRLVHYPPGEHEDLVIVWLWAERDGVFSHETALALHDLSDVLPAKIHISLPTAVGSRRRRVPPGVVVHYADVPTTDRTWVATVPATTARRTLVDCALAGVSPDFLEQAAEQAVRRGLIARIELAEVERALHLSTKVTQ